MPRILNPQTGTERSVTDAEFNRIIDFGEGRVFQPSWDDSGNVSLLDTVDGTVLTVPRQLAMEHYSRVVVCACTKCTFTSTFERDVEKHIRQVREATRGHNGARLLDLVEGGRFLGKQCTGCGNSFMARHDQGQKHLDRVLEGESIHDGAEMKIKLRYALPQPTKAGVS